MSEVLIQMAVLIACGSVWRVFQPGELGVDIVRKALANLVYYLLLPALVLQVLWEASVGLDTARISLVASAGVLVGMALGYMVCRALKVSKAITGALILAAAFPNATYLGLPVLDATLGHWSRSIAIQYDLFACTPLLLTLGVLVARHYSTNNSSTKSSAGNEKISLVSLSNKNAVLAVLKVPAVWAAIVAMSLNLGAVSSPRILTDVLGLLATGVVPLMLISLGMSLRWNFSWLNDLQIILPIVFIQLLIVPMAAWFIAQGVGINDELLMAVVLEAAMPSMVLGIVFCDRYGLDTSMYAASVTLSTLFSLFTLPLWFNWMQNNLHIYYGG
ncbi:MAG: AEC family transporter [Gammaproteobacteria bacterium]|nr:AEC family transporter [Gammaproteobacteria bacterium]